MKVYIQCDLECVAGVVTLPEYCLPDPENKYGRKEGGKHHELAKELATVEVNAAAEGLLEAGATEILVCDGHGPGGLNPSLLHAEARIVTGRGRGVAAGLDNSFDAAMMLGQHAMADTDGGHLCHSGSFSRAEWRLNGELIGEIGLSVLATDYYDVPMVMISGDVAGCEEARRLLPAIETVAVIEGFKRGSTKGMTTDEAIDFNVAAIHVSPIKARQMIRQGAKRALGKIGSAGRFHVDPPYEMIRVTREFRGTPPRRAVNRSDDLLDLMTQKPSYSPLEEARDGSTGKEL